jgi:hypothetical protein
MPGSAGGDAGEQEEAAEAVMGRRQVSGIRRQESQKTHPTGSWLVKIPTYPKRWDMRHAKAKAQIHNTSLFTTLKHGASTAGAKARNLDSTLRHD